MAIKTTESGTTLRNRLAKSIVLAIRTLMQKGEPDKESLDMAAFVVLALEKISESVDQSATAWEKRDFWLKADRFRMEWDWTLNYKNSLETAVLAENWAEIPLVLVQIAQKLGSIEVAAKHRLGTPWVGAWKVLKSR